MVTRRRSTGETLLGLALLVTFVAVWYCVIAQWPAISEPLPSVPAALPSGAVPSAVVGAAPRVRPAVAADPTSGGHMGPPLHTTQPTITGHWPHPAHARSARATTPTGAHP